MPWELVWVVGACATHENGVDCCVVPKVKVGRIRYCWLLDACRHKIIQTHNNVSWD